MGVSKIPMIPSVTYEGFMNSGKDCNNALLNSVYLCWASASNSPGYVGILMCVGISNDKRQIAFPTDSSGSYKIKTRRYTDGSWTNWREI